MELDDGSGGLAGWAFVEGFSGEVEAVVVAGVIVSGGGSGCDVEVALGFDLAADANSAGNGVLLAAMPQAYSISPCNAHYLSHLLEPQTLPRPAGLSFFLLRGSDAPMGGTTCSRPHLFLTLSFSRLDCTPSRPGGGPTPSRYSNQSMVPTVKVFALEISVPVQPVWAA